jgi:hypothetical protein
MTGPNSLASQCHPKMVGGVLRGGAVVVGLRWRVQVEK